MNPTMILHRRLASLLVVLMALGCLHVAVVAQSNANPPERMAYQGFLVDANGVALGNSAPRNYDVVFRVWTAQTGGTRLWSEQQTVTVDKGFFNVLLGEGSAVTGEARPSLSSVFAGADVSDRYVSVTVKAPGLGTTDIEIAPRLRLVTSPFSFLARQAVSVVNASGASLVQGNGAALQINVPVQAAGGNGRGSGATDLQVNRASNDQVASGNASTIAGGQNNRASGVASTVSGGADNAATFPRASVSGGGGNVAGGENATVGGGLGNSSTGTGAVVGGGTSNRAGGADSFVGGGTSNVVSGTAAVVSGGLGNAASADRSTVSGGAGNTASGNDSMVPGGRSNVASGAVSMAAGYRAKANHNGAWVWADSVDADFASRANNEVAMRATGGVRIVGARPESAAVQKQLVITDTALNSPNFALQLGYRFQPGVMAQGIIESLDNNMPSVLALQPRGGSVAIGKDTVPTSALDVNGVVTATRFVGDGTIPVGAIVLWSGQVATIPSGWALCDGANGTPDLRSRFVVGASGAVGPAGLTRYEAGAVGGTEAHVLTVAQMPSHTHRPAGRYIGDPDGGWDTRGEGNHYLSLRWGSDGYGADQEYQRTSSAGGNQPHENRPPYYALAYIMRTR